MTFANVLIYVALIALVLARRFRGHPIDNVRKLFVLPVVVTIIGYADLTHGGLKPLAVTLTVVGAILSLGLGSLRGRADKVSQRDGFPFVQWGVMSLVLFCVNIAAKLVLDIIGVAAGETFSTAGKSLIFTLGLTLVGEAIVLSVRSGAAWSGGARSGGARSGGARSGSAGQPPRTSDAPAAWTPDHEPAYSLRQDRQEGEYRQDREYSQDREYRHEHHHHDHHGRREN
jgi:hypothetical protein